MNLDTPMKFCEVHHFICSQLQHPRYKHILYKSYGHSTMKKWNNIFGCLGIYSLGFWEGGGGRGFKKYILYYLYHWFIFFIFFILEVKIKIDMWKKMPNNFALLTLHINLYGKLETKFINFHYLNIVATLALGSWPRQKGSKVAGQEKARESRQKEARVSHHILSGV
jgi:hypothetical protein